MISFLAKICFLCWPLAIVVGVRCFHVLCTRSQVETVCPIALEEEETAWNSSNLLQRAHLARLPETQGAF
jgi:hypothetical protein